MLVEKKLKELEKLPQEFENCADGRDFHVLALSMVGKHFLDIFSV